MQTGDTRIFDIRDRSGKTLHTIFNVDNVKFDGRNNMFIIQTIYKEKHFIPCVDTEQYYTNAFILGERRGY